jgi:hypothetical protein
MPTDAWCGRLFDAHGGSITEYLRKQIQTRFGVDNVPASFFFLPEDFGGLGVKNPFIPFFMLKNRVTRRPQDRIDQFRKDEERAYKEASEAFATLTETEKQRRMRQSFGESTKHAAIIDEQFFSFDEFCAHRENYSHHLLNAFDDLMLKPSVQDIKLAKGIAPWFDELLHTHGQSWYSLSSEARWTMSLYADELKERFGALSIVDRNLLPGGVMKMLKQKKVTWQMVIWE